MQFFSFDFKDPIYDFDGWKLSFQIITLENTYGLNPDKTQFTQGNGFWELVCEELSFAGQQQRKAGRFTLQAVTNDQGQLVLKISAAASDKIRCVKVLVRELDAVAVYNANTESEVIVNADGDIYHYPYNSSQRENNLKVPVFFAREIDKNGFLAFQCQDHKVRDKRFAVYPEKVGAAEGTYTIELIHEESASRFDDKIDVPAWVLGRNADREKFLNQYLAFAESPDGIGLIPWKDRSDMPSWAKQISLCLTLHGMHWSGYVFNTYNQMLEIIRYAAERTDGNHILAYLPGWEGRYYWQYGDYRPEPLLGGEEGFLRLCAEARKLGVHVMPMFGANCANAWLSNFPQYGTDAYMKTATRNRYHGNVPDWDMSRSHDTGWQAWLNPGAPSWQTELTRQITRLIDQYGFDSVFLDTAHHWVNDPDFDVCQGLKDLKHAIVKGRPDVLVTAENWYDGLLTIFPLFQSRPFLKNPGWVGRYARMVAHLLEAEPSRGSTGVHELGYCRYEPKELKEEYIPTIAFVDGTFEQAKAEFDKVIEMANRYKSMFL